ncbi:hypothetical protein AOLI_G00065170 [Acnodon oligacanthus]
MGQVGESTTVQKVYYLLRRWGWSISWPPANSNGTETEQLANLVQDLLRSFKKQDHLETLHTQIKVSAPLCTDNYRKKVKNFETDDNYNIDTT